MPGTGASIYRLTYSRPSASAVAIASGAAGNTPIERKYRPINGMAIMVLTLLVTGGVAWLLYRSRWGLRVRCTTANREMSGAVEVHGGAPPSDRMSAESVHVQAAVACWPSGREAYLASRNGP
jgi:ABC-type uncharacterized transport system permease subunit